jgi:DNA-binding MarR family transcriptional regulator
MAVARRQGRAQTAKLDVHILNMVAKSQAGMQVSQGDSESSRVVLELLEAIERQGEQSQRAMADKFGVALGLVNAYLKICIKKGYVKVKRLPPRRYVYMLTPKGMSEKVRLTLLLLSRELHSFRRARADYREACDAARARNWRRVVLIGASELAEISALCALETGIEIAAVVDGDLAAERFIGVPVVPALADIPGPYDGALITAVRESHSVYRQATALLGAERVIAPAFFGFMAPPRQIGRGEQGLLT